MIWNDYFWTPEALEKIFEHGLTQEEVEFIIEHPENVEPNRSTGRTVAEGYAHTGTYVVVIYERIDEITILPITAFTPDKEDIR